MFFLDLPDDIIRVVLSTWITVDHWILLQSAWCNKCSWVLLSSVMRSTVCTVKFESALKNIKWTVENRMDVGILSLKLYDLQGISQSFKPNRLHSLTLEVAAVTRELRVAVIRFCAGLIDRNPNLTNLNIDFFSEDVERAIAKLTNLKFLRILRPGEFFKGAQLAFLEVVVANNKQLIDVLCTTDPIALAFRSGVLHVSFKRKWIRPVCKLVKSMSSRITELNFTIKPLKVPEIFEIVNCVPFSVTRYCRYQKKPKHEFLVGVSKDLRKQFRWMQADLGRTYSF